MASRFEWKWNPTAPQMEMFKEWENYVIGYLVSSREGVNVRSIPGLLNEITGDDIPLHKMGFRTINQFMYEMRDSIEVRTLNEKLYIFIKESAVPFSMMDTRKLVLGQAKDKGCKTKTGVIKRPTKNQSTFVRPEKLLDAVQHIINRPNNYTNYRPVVAPASSVPTRRPGGPLNNFHSRPNSSSGSVNRAPGYSRNNTAYGHRQSQSYSTSAPKPYVQPPRPTTTAAARPIASVNGKENYYSSKPTATLLNGRCGSTSSTSSLTSQCQVSRIPRIPQGLILSDDDTDDDSDSEFDYCGGPIKMSTIKGQANTQVPNSTPPVSVASNRPTVAPQGNSTMSNSTAKPASSVTSSVTSNSSGNIYRTSNTTSSASMQPPLLVNPETPLKPAAASVPKPIEPTPTPMPVLPKAVGSTPLIKPAMTFKSTSCANLSSDNNKPIQQKEALTKVNGKEATTLRKESSIMPSVGLSLDTGNVLNQFAHSPMQKMAASAVRMVLSVPKIRFPQFLRGGSLQANVGLRGYLASISGKNVWID